MLSHVHVVCLLILSYCAERIYIHTAEPALLSPGLRGHHPIAVSLGKSCNCCQYQQYIGLAGWFIPATSLIRPNISGPWVIA